MRIFAATLMIFAATFAFAETVEVHFAVLSSDLDEVTAVEFRVDNLPEEFCTIETNWSTPLTIGELGYNLSLAFAPPLQGPYFYLGSVYFTANDELGEDWVMQVMAGLETGLLVVIDGNFDQHDAIGYHYAFNCDVSSPPFCTCEYIVDPPLRQNPVIGMFTDYGEWTVCHQDLPFIPTSVPSEQELMDPSGWSLIKSLY